MKILQKLRQSRSANFLRRAKRRLTGADRYDARNYWESQLSRYGNNLRGPGNGSLSEEENIRIYEQGKSALGELTAQLGVDWTSAFAEIGPGNGYWLKWLSARGVSRYTGFDITDALFPLIRNEFPHASLGRLDVTEHPIPGSFDVLLMIDVTQHITDEKKFRKAMSHCRAAVHPGGLFIVTSWLRPYKKFSEAEVMRPLESYTSSFEGWKVTGPAPFRDKLIMAFRRPQADSEPVTGTAGLTR